MGYMECNPFIVHTAGS